MTFADWFMALVFIVGFACVCYGLAQRGKGGLYAAESVRVRERRIDRRAARRGRRVA